MTSPAETAGRQPLVLHAWLTADPALLGWAAGRSADLVEGLRSVGRQLGSATPPDWHGDAERAEQAAIANIQARLQTLATILTLLGEELARLAGELADAQRQWWQAVHGERTAVTRHPGTGLAVEISLAERVRAVEVAEALSRADERAAAAIAALPRWHPQVPMRGGRQAPASDVARWWSGLLPAVQSGLLGGGAAGVLARSLAGMDGIPEALRDAANRRALASAVAARPRAAGLAGLRAALAEPDASRLLLFDPAGDGRAVVGVGPLATATHLVVIVPGMTTTLTDIDRLVREARALLAARRPGDSLAAVAWLGYDAPDLVQVVSAAAARAGATSLESFVAGLRVSHPGASVTVVGHSYGALVTATAARHGLGADELVFVGAPGTGARSARQLGPPSRVWAARAAEDPIAAVFQVGLPLRILALGLAAPTAVSPIYRYGPDPVSARFGATVFRTGDTVHGHSEYFRPGSDSVRNIERIAVEDPSAVTLRR